MQKTVWLSISAETRKWLRQACGCLNHSASSVQPAAFYGVRRISVPFVTSGFFVQCGRNWPVDREVIGRRGKIISHVCAFQCSPEWCENNQGLLSRSTSRAAVRWKYINKTVRITRDAENHSRFFQASQGRAVYLQLIPTTLHSPEAAADLEDDALGLVGTHLAFQSDFQPDSLEAVPLGTFWAEEMSHRRQHFTQACPSFMSLNVFYPHHPLPGWGLWRCLSLLRICWCLVQLAQLPDVFLVLLSFLDVREDETAADKLCLKINHPCWMVPFLFLV